MALNSFEKNGVTYFELYISCPVCVDRGNNTPHAYWSHHNNNCNGDIYMGENAFYYCKNVELPNMFISGNMVVLIILQVTMNFWRHLQLH